MRTLPLSLETRVGRRIVLLFVVSALVPVGALAALGYAQVRRQLVADAEGQLSQAAKAVGMGVLDQLRGARTALADARTIVSRSGLGALAGSSDTTAIHAIFGSVAVVGAHGREVAWG